MFSALYGFFHLCVYAAKCTHTHKLNKNHLILQNVKQDTHEQYSAEVNGDAQACRQV